MAPSCESRSNHAPKRERVGGAEQREHDPARYERVFLGADVGGIQREV